ncbi:MAG: hypothetical protein JW938_08115, partial [Candidatus Omnitrophica bacterium]|nr:hypothetical protein [Candidatus Omnitrophota bacterium]
MRAKSWFLTCFSKTSYKKKAVIRAIMAGFTIAMIAFSCSAFAASDGISLLDGNERGMTTSEMAKGIMTPGFDESLQQDVLEVRYSIASGTSLEIWAKGFPVELSAETANTAKISMKVPDIEQVDQIDLVVIVRGTSGVQNVPLSLKNGWSFENIAI